ncbi:hypothetical protein [Fervidibacillus albus]|uniref:Endonuclease/exonuclease/phosphatase family protein n=1 Tax=Fervidibacillus albus TaxID=2980026 RepID=A0A9E8RVI0_9BACI|nr:hypothetical protein [Fervidibacillus albus]WAA08958.1 endonuclease/exonuclease/phosphatase family protein [Fervidibacillus albus]
MRILSLNINNFGGLKNKEQYKRTGQLQKWNNLNKTNVATAIFTYIQQEIPDIVILHEFEMNTGLSNQFIKSLNDIGYGIIPYDENKFKNPSITIMFVRKEWLYEKLDNPHKSKTGKILRASVIKVADCIIYGVHVPLKNGMVFWDELIDFYKIHREEKIVIIGDLNVYDLGTKQKQKYLELLKSNAIDAWREKGNPNSTKTHIAGRRLDYAIMSPTLYKYLNSIRIDPYLMNYGKTDHAALIIEI